MTDIKELALQEAHKMDWEDLTNQGSGSCVASHGCAGVTQSDLTDFATRLIAAYLKEQEPVAWDGAEEWEQLAWNLCAEEGGEESCTELLWDGGPTPEPWGDRWLKYEGEAKRMISLVRKFTAPPEPAPQMPLGVSEGTATSACAAQLQDQVENLAALVNRLCRQVNKFDSGNAVAVAASKYIFDNDLIKTSLRKDDEGIRKIIDMVNSHG